MLTVASEEKENSTVSVIIVTHNSQKVIDRCLDRIQNQTIRPKQIIIVDSGSDETDYLQNYRFIQECTVHLSPNRGFGAANNLGITLLETVPTYSLFVNPDTFIEHSCIEEGMKIMSQNQDIAILTGNLKGYSRETDQPTGLLDSTGIFRKWYGRWYDRDQGLPEGSIQRKAGDIPAICGAFMFCRSQALESEFPLLFDESFSMYKEDIDLSIRLRKRGWKMYYTPELSAFHCRGWSQDRKRIDRKIRLLAAQNEIRLCFKHRSPYILWALLKYTLVRFCNI